FSYKPEFINVSFSKSNDPNLITAKVRWRLRILCRRDPAVHLRVLLSGTAKLEKNIPKFKYVASDSTKLYADDETSFPDLVPYSNYALQFITDDHSNDAKNRVTTTKSFRTPHGVPTSRPTIRPIVRGVNDCIENKRNVTVVWTPPPVKGRNGIIRNMTVKYFKKKSVPQLIFLPNVTSTVIFGLDCDVEYQVQVRACMHVNESCSPYSDAQVIPIQFRDDGTETPDGSNVFLWASVGVGLPVTLVALAACQYIYRRKRRTPLEQLKENVDYEYETAEKTDLSEMGNYDLVDEQGRYNDTVGSGNSDTF
ncbi:neural cell adhesion molecule L1 isoform X1, partial [Paramuricea clavata]